jgi:alanine racemase
MSVVKGNAYGHGLQEVVSILEGSTDRFGIISIEDLRALRKITHKPALLLGYIAKDDLEEAVALKGTLVVYDTERIILLNDIGKRTGTKPIVHLKIDAALGRQGIMPEDLEQFLSDIKPYTHITIEGIYAHFANIEDTEDFSHAQKQINLFEQAKEIMKKHGYTQLITHIASTAGTLVYEQDKKVNTMVRLGLGLYGMWPSLYISSQMKAKGLELKPALRWVTHIAQVKSVPAAFTIGYGLTYRTTAPMTVAVVPQGYSDGYDRGLSNKGAVLIHGKRCSILGRVAMNMFVVDVTHLQNVQAEDEVVLLGMQGEEEISAEELAEYLDTINYEVTTRISSLLPRKSVTSF